MQQEYLQIGEIVRPQGIRGEVKLRAMTEDMSRYARLESVFLKKGGRLEEKKVLKGRSYDGFAFLQLEGVNDRDAAEALRGTEVYVDRKHAIKLGADENFVCELIGLKAVDENGFLGVFMGGFTASAVGISAALVFGYLASLIFKPKMKK